eukprot:CAMPEP_0172695202 /NCGR_PEP_ID=MMETSP1074-20121228/27201_1 /TAXON_ID=2916 /ORGANISM="Ceratium fusus, Strain PA161109" /LENGTH=153 /DNA_ID=CAMNT_0013515797 /DNA_START=151 /DNA_END=608 /DNA_ORIENTATION=+
MPIKCEMAQHSIVDLGHTSSAGHALAHVWAQRSGNGPVAEVLGRQPPRAQARVAELRAMCKERMLAVSGNKQVLIDRLRAAAVAGSPHEEEPVATGYAAPTMPCLQHDAMAASAFGDAAASSAILQHGTKAASAIGDTAPAVPFLFAAWYEGC